MSNYNYPFGHRPDWCFNFGGSMRKTNKQTGGGVVQDCIIAEQDKRKADGETRPKYSSQMMVAMLPEAPKTNKSVDEIVHEGLAIIDLLDQL